MLTRIQSKFAVCLFLALFNGVAGVLLFLARGLVPMAIVLIVVSLLLIMLVIIPPPKDKLEVKSQKSSSVQSKKPKKNQSEDYSATFATVLATTGLLLGSAGGVPLEDVQRNETDVIEVRKYRREETRISDELIDYSQVQPQNSLPVTAKLELEETAAPKELKENKEQYQRKQKTYKQQQQYNQQLWGDARPWQISDHYRPNLWQGPK